MELPYRELLVLYPEVFSFKHLIKINLNYQAKKKILKSEWEKQRQTLTFQTYMSELSI